MNNLAAAFYMMSQGVPFLHAGEEMLRSKPDGKGGVVENSYKSSDAVNSIKWDLLDQRIYRHTYAYYKGLIAFRKAHPTLRMTSTKDILSNITVVPCGHPQMCAFKLRGNVDGEAADELFLVFNASETSQMITLPHGIWQICINDKVAGNDSICMVEDQVSVAPISALVLIKGNLT